MVVGLTGCIFNSHTLIRQTVNDSEFNTFNFNGVEFNGTVRYKIVKSIIV